MVISNSEPRGGAIVGFNVGMLLPPSTLLTGSLVDRISCSWEIGQQLLQPEFTSSSKALFPSETTNRSDLIARVHLTLKLDNPAANAPASNFVTVQESIQTLSSTSPTNLLPVGAKSSPKRRKQLFDQPSLNWPNQGCLRNTLLYTDLYYVCLAGS